MTIVGSNRLLGCPRFIAAMLVGAVTLAGATYSATATATIALSFNIDPGANGTTVDQFTEVVPDAPDFDTFLDLLLTGDDQSGSFAFGNATAGHSGTAALPGTGIGSTQSATVSGSTSPAGESIALQLTNGFMTIDNSTGTDAIIVTVDIDYSYFLLATASDNINEYGEATASIIVDLFVDDAFIDGLDIFETAFTDIGVSSDSLSDSDSLTLVFTVLAGEIGYVDIFVDAAGFAESIPEPAIALIFGIGLLAAGAARRRTR